MESYQRMETTRFYIDPYITLHWMPQEGVKWGDRDKMNAIAPFKFHCLRCGKKGVTYFRDYECQCSGFPMTRVTVNDDEGEMRK